MATLNEEYKQLVGDNTSTINSMYDAQKEAQISQLDSAYQQNLADAQAQKQTIDQTYNRSANDLAAQYERNRRNTAEQAALSGINTGTGSQIALAQNAGYQRDMGSLRTQQANDQTAQDRAIANLKLQYEGNVREAIANSDYARAAALIDEYNRQNTQTMNAWQMQKNDEATEYERQSNIAALLASSGDYSGYAKLFGLTPDQSGLLASQWIANNPLSAYGSGMITADQYRAITGQYAPGAEPVYSYSPASTKNTATGTVPATISAPSAPTTEKFNGNNVSVLFEATKIAKTQGDAAAQRYLDNQYAAGNISVGQYNTAVATANGQNVTTKKKGQGNGGR